MIREFSVELTADDERAIQALVGAETRVHPDIRPGRKTYAFDDAALIASYDGDFDRFLWSAFDRVEERDGVITIAKGRDLVFYLPVAKLQDADVRRAIWDFVSGRVGLNA